MAKRVTFCLMPPHDVHFIPSRQDMTTDEHCRLWYPESIIEDFKYKARTVSRSLRSHDQAASCTKRTTSKYDNPMNDGNFLQSCGSAPATSQLAITLNKQKQEELLQSQQRVKHHKMYADKSTPPSQSDFFRRGLEHRICLERQLKRHVATKSILRYHKEHKHDAHCLSLLAERHTRWAKSIALQTGIQDAKDAAQDYIEFFCGSPSNKAATETAADLNRKRTLSEVATTTVQQLHHEVSKRVVCQASEANDSSCTPRTTQARAA